MVTSGALALRGIDLVPSPLPCSGTRKKTGIWYPSWPAPSYLDAQPREGTSGTRRIAIRERLCRHGWSRSTLTRWSPPPGDPLRQGPPGQDSCSPRRLTKRDTSISRERCVIRASRARRRAARDLGTPASALTRPSRAARWTSGSIDLCESTCRRQVPASRSGVAARRGEQAQQAQQAGEVACGRVAVREWVPRFPARRQRQLVTLVCTGRDRRTVSRS